MHPGEAVEPPKPKRKVSQQPEPPQLPVDSRHRNDGLQNSQINVLPAYLYRPVTSADADTECSICFEDFRAGLWVRPLPECLHVFHLHCINDWLQRRATCPSCSMTIIVS
eukprot:NODE_2757_length_509_cov_40.387435_g2707_i0.p2 GENE.NODE_2757_length_509_cov_40.387435_g2707_i0~~NODE_2757_length_509_cov_40.387435_g2707_i0.p2  ORF type:complete len:110 (+),score=2.90 NODE_2757_length_509_cov_40.387435_g2707_i0:69-398(+)